MTISETAFRQRLVSHWRRLLLSLIVTTSSGRTDKISPAGLDKLTNANWSVSTVNGRLFPVELTEIADWKSMSEYMLHLNFGKTLTRVICGNFGSYNLKLPLPYFLNICLPFWVFYKWKEYLNKKFFGISANKLWSFSKAQSSGSVWVQSAK